MSVDVTPEEQAADDLRNNRRIIFDELFFAMASEKRRAMADEWQGRYIAERERLRAVQSQP